MNVRKTFQVTKINEQGFAPIIVSIIIILVLSLLTLGFVTLINTNQNNSLNLQLNNDAYYAAESGINDAINAMNNGFHSAKTQCGPYSSGSYLTNNQVNGPSDIYSCLLINPMPNSLQYGSVQSAQPTVALLTTVNPTTHANQNATSLVFSWQPSAQTTSSPYYFAQNCTTNQCFPPVSQWDSNGNPVTGVLRLSLTALVSGQPVPTDTSTTFTAFLYPSPAPGSNTVDNINSQGVNSGNIISGGCSNNNINTPDACSVTINVAAAAPGSGASPVGFLMALRSIYLPSQVTVQAFHGSQSLDFLNAQTLIDSTGDDHGVLKRIQVRVASINDTGFPGFDVSATNYICKELYAYPPNYATNSPGGATNTSANCSF